MYIIRVGDMRGIFYWLKPKNLQYNKESSNISENYFPIITTHIFSLPYMRMTTRFILPSF